jgi:hypothetical protein
MTTTAMTALSFVVVVVVVVSMMMPLKMNYWKRSILLHGVVEAEEEAVTDLIMDLRNQDCCYPRVEHSAFQAVRYFHGQVRHLVSYF